MMNGEPVNEASRWMTALTSHSWLAKGTRNPILLWRMGLGSLIGKSLMIITQTGRTSGLPRRTVTQYHRSGETIYAPAALGSKAKWYRNLMADPIATLQMDSDPIYARARRVTDPGEIRQYYENMASQHPRMTRTFLEEVGINPDDFDDLVARRDRLYVVAFEPVTTPGPPPVPKDLTWVPIVIGVISLIAAMATRRRSKKG